MDTKLKVLFVGEGTVSDAVRCMAPAKELSRMGVAECGFKELHYRDDSPVMDPEWDAVVFSRPHHDSLILSCKRQNIPVIVDMDDDFHAIPESHPGYKIVGRGDPLYLGKLENCLYLADLITVAMPELGRRMNRFNKCITTVPNGWESTNFLWNAKRTIWTDRVILGWGGTITHRQDWQQAVEPVKRILKHYPEAMLCVAGDPAVYQMFASVLESQKLFIPMVNYDFYPYLLSLFDIMLVPLDDNEFNAGKSDIKLVEAGAKGIPYVASDVPIYRDWPGGGILVNPKGWYDAIACYLKDPDRRKADGLRGRKAAAPRDFSGALGDLWWEVIQKAISKGNCP